MGHAARLSGGSAAATRHDAGRPNLRRADGCGGARGALAAGQGGRRRGARGGLDVRGRGGLHRGARAARLGRLPTGRTQRQSAPQPGPARSASPARARTSGSRSRSPTTRPGRRCCASPGPTRRSIVTSGRRPPSASPMSNALEAAVGEWTQALGRPDAAGAATARGGGGRCGAFNALAPHRSAARSARLVALSRTPRHRGASLRRLPLALLADPRLGHPTSAPARRAHRRDSWLGCWVTARRRLAGGLRPG